LLDDSGFRHLRLKVLLPDRQTSTEVLGRILNDPDFSATIVEAGAAGAGMFFELEIFGVGSKVDELLAFDWVGARSAHGVRVSETEPPLEPDVQDAPQEEPAHQLELVGS
jgi:hypothetical protein